MYSLYRQFINIEQVCINVSGWPEEDRLSWTPLLQANAKHTYKLMKIVPGPQCYVMSLQNPASTTLPKALSCDTQWSGSCNNFLNSIFRLHIQGRWLIFSDLPSLVWFMPYWYYGDVSKLSTRLLYYTFGVRPDTLQTAAVDLAANGTFLHIYFN